MALAANDTIRKQNLSSSLSGCSQGSVDVKEATEKVANIDSADIKMNDEAIDHEELNEYVMPDEQFTFTNVEIKTEPVDTEPDSDETLVNEPALVDTTHATVKSSTDGKVELELAPAAISTAPSRIKVNITKPLSTAKESEDPKNKHLNSETSINEKPQPLVSTSLKPSLQGRKLLVLFPAEHLMNYLIFA